MLHSRLHVTLISLIIVLLYSCQTENKIRDRYGYAIKDFRDQLQPELDRIVTNGVVKYFDIALRNMATDNELVKLSQSEHPILRAASFREMLQRKTFNHFDILMNNLDDTAIIISDDGEFGLNNRRVSDDILLEATWESIEDKNRTIDKVLTKHNYLYCAYMILDIIEPNQKYYPFIKDMATRKRKYNGDYEENFYEIEFALLGLAKFRKKEDVKIIKELLLINTPQLSDRSFSLMQNFPDTAYLEVYEKYYSDEYYHSMCSSDWSSKSSNFIGSIAAYKNDRSAKILENIMNRKPFANCTPDSNYVKKELFSAIWKNDCSAYYKLRKKVSGNIELYKKKNNNADMIIPSQIPEDSIKPIIIWVK